MAGSDQQPCDKEETGRPESKCKHHIAENVQLYCKECEEPICRNCVVTGTHTNHTLLKIEDAVKSKGAELSAMTDKRLSDLTNSLTSIQKNKTDYTKDISTNRVQVKLKSTQLKSELDIITHDILHQLESREKEDMNQLKTREETIEAELSRVKDIIKEFQAIKSRNDVDEIAFILEAKQKLNALTNNGPPEPLLPPDHLAKHMDLSNLKGVITEIRPKDQGENPPPKPKRNLPKAEVNLPKAEASPPRNIEPDFVTEGKVLSFSCPGKRKAVTLSDGKAWLTDYWTNDVSLMSNEGYLIRSVETDGVVFDIAVTNDDDFLYTTNDGNKVTKFVDDNLRVIYEDYSGFTARGITVTDDGSIVVCLYNEKTKEGKLTCLADTGITTVEYDADDGKSLFQNPMRVCSNRNGDLIVLQKNKIIIVIDSCKRKRFSYDGRVKGRDGTAAEGLKKVKDYDPGDIVTDKHGHILISDNNNSCVHILDKDGNFLKLIDTKALGLLYPLGMCIDASGRLVVCSYVIGKINAVTYLAKDENVK